MRKALATWLAAWLAGVGLGLVQPQAARAQYATAPEAKGGQAADDGGDTASIWGSAGFLLWWFKCPLPVPAPLLGTAAPGGAFAPSGAGGTINPLTQGGAKFTLGDWLDSDDTLGVEGNFFFFAQKSRTQSAGSTSMPVGTAFLIPLIEPGKVTGPGIFLVENAVPGSSAANTLQLRDRLYGYEANGILNLARAPSYQLDVIGGFRYLEFDESLGFTAAGNSPLIFQPNGLLIPFPFPTPFALGAAFGDQNRFWGGNLGACGEYRLGNFFVNATGKVALGVMEENLSAGTVLTGAGGILSGHSFGSVSRFAVVPEGTATVGYQFADWARASAGCDFLYASDVLRPGEQVNPISPFALAPVPRHTDFWARGFNIGLEFRF